MNSLNLKSWSEGQQVLAVILMAGLLIFTLWFSLLLPLSRRRQLLENDIEEMRSYLRQKNYLLDEATLQKKKLEEHRQGALLYEEWVEASARLATFENQEELTTSLVGHIDFKVALFDVQQRLRKKSRALGIGLPYDLGMAETVGSEEDARKLMLQLRAVEKLVDLGLDLKIGMIRDVKPAAPLSFGAGANNETFLEEYPVTIRFFGRLENVYDLLRALLEPEHAFMLRNLRIEATSGRERGLLDVTASVSALVFLKDPKDVKLAPDLPDIQIVPGGH
jgi:Tfp pilus assembly protein PilO